MNPYKNYQTVKIQDKFIKKVLFLFLITYVIHKRFS